MDKRVHTLTSPKQTSGNEVVYFMQNSIRANYNPALEYAVAFANDAKLPLSVYHVFDYKDATGAVLTERNAFFTLETLKEAQADLLCDDIDLIIVDSKGNAESQMIRLAKNAAMVICDTNYLARTRAQHKSIARALGAKSKVMVVEGNIVVPVEVASDKLEHSARTIRPRIHKNLENYLSVPAQPRQLEIISAGSGVASMDLGNIENLVRSMKFIDTRVGRIPGTPGGSSHAYTRLNEFLARKIQKYEESRNEPAIDCQSGLSPYLRIGAISPVEVALRAKATGKPGLADFLEELIVRRELAMNMCYYCPQYDTYREVVPSFARVTLAIHKRDKRPVLYSFSELENAQTEDKYWNSAQMELIKTGTIHGYMRMYWGKRILLWTRDPETAFEYIRDLNNKWSLDAADPNSYAGIAWIFGRHDQGWVERAIYGKVRIMNESGIKKKQDMQRYIAKFE